MPNSFPIILEKCPTLIEWPFVYESLTSIVLAIASIDSIVIPFNSFSLYSVLLRLFPPFYLPGLLSILLPQLLYCWFPLVYFQSWLFHCWLFNSSRSLLNSSYIFLINPSSLSVSTFCFQGFGSSLLLLFWILFQVDSLSPPLGLVWWVFVMFLHLLNISLPFHFV